MNHITCIDDLRLIAKKRVPRMFFDYADAGAWTEATYRANESDLAKLTFRPRVAIDVSQRSLTTTILGRSYAMPIALAPVGLTGMQWADGEILAARAAEQANVPFTLSTMSICSIEDVAANTGQPFWFQLYVMRDREFVKRLIARAKAANCTALVVTLDMPLVGQRNKDIRNGLSVRPALTLANLVQFASRPAWSLAMSRTSRREFGNIIGHARDVVDMASLWTWTANQFEPALTWADVKWIRRLWNGPLVLKGIMDRDDAVQAANIGADALIVSNHGGRQLDGASSSIAVLADIANAVHGRLEVHMDGGVRSGQDVLRALALGARTAHIGRAFIYGLGAMGEQGVVRCLDLLRNELEITMGLCGRSNVQQIDASVLAATRNFDFRS